MFLHVHEVLLVFSKYVNAYKLTHWKAHLVKINLAFKCFKLRHHESFQSLYDKLKRGGNIAAAVTLAYCYYAYHLQSLFSEKGCFFEAFKSTIINLFWGAGRSTFIK